MPRPRLRVCTVPGCPNLTVGGKCASHARAARAEKDAVRGNWRERGYDAEYDRNRAIVIREETHCAICSELVDKSLPGTDPDGPSADHIVRREDGGTNERSNLRLTHLRCNTGRRDKPGPNTKTERPEPRVYRSGSPGLR